MHEVMAAGLKAMRDLGRGDILWQALWPPLLAFAGWSVVAWLSWMPLAAWLLDKLPTWSWLAWLGPYLVHVALVLCFAPLIYVTTLLLVAVIALPRMMIIIGQRDYPDVSRQASAGSAFMGSLWNTVAASAIFVVGWLLCLPLLLVPGGLLVLPLLWSAWLNQRTFRFDVLAEHATADERNALIRQERSRFRLAGFASALAAHVPLLNLLAPAFAALLFSHLGLSALRQLRAKEGVWVQ
ncbi:MAG: EI24 domain-containing protein [Gammaproteobacteria bacterium]|nr:EI24 domain-containing protein [Gammaproteobacteria bacterium]MBU1415868.1 EI24 domain-containing protein [Gammaproteobacteria bacterium]